MATRKVAKKVAPSKGASAKKAVANKEPSKKASVAKACCLKLAADKKKALKKTSQKTGSVKTPVSKKSASKVGISTKVKPLQESGFNSEQAADKVELEGVKNEVSVEALKIGLLLAAIDGNCDKNEIAKFKTIASSCGGLSDAKITQIISQTKRRISSLEEAARHGASEDEMVSKFMSEASNIGIGSDCRNFVLWMSIAMVDGDYSNIERRAIKELQRHVNRFGSSLSFLSRRRASNISDIFLQRCEMILAGMYKAESLGSKRMSQNRMKSLQTLIEIAEA